jgi:hypothetical protein
MPVRKKMVNVDISKLALLKGPILQLFYPMWWKPVLKFQEFGKPEAVF